MSEAKDGMCALEPKVGYVLEFEDTFDGDGLDEGRWIPCYLPQWTTRAASAARYRVGDGHLRLLIEEDQPAWSPEMAGRMRVSSLQTGVFSGPVGSAVGQHRRGGRAVVREAQEEVRLHTPHFGLVEMRARASDDPLTMVALWMIGFEERVPRRGGAREGGAVPQGVRGRLRAGLPALMSPVRRGARLAAERRRIGESDCRDGG